MAAKKSGKRSPRSLSNGGIQRSNTRAFGRTNLQVSPIGFGGYRIHIQEQAHQAALEHALLNGVNLIDTSSNYTDGGSELLVGEVVTRLDRTGKLARDQVVLVSKAGYIQGKNLEMARQREESGDPFPDAVKVMDGCWHCIHPEFLETQILQSLTRLQQDRIDVYLLHNPEYFLADARRRGLEDTESLYEQYHQRIAMAFDWLEEKVAEGLIRAYGISSNTFPVPSNHPEFTSLERILGVAESVSANSHFQVIQFPMNLVETGAATEKNQHGGARTLLDLARERNLATLVNRPLNASTPQGLIRLATFRSADPESIHREFETRRQSLAKLEARFHEEFFPSLPSRLPRDRIRQVFNLSEQLAPALTSFPGWEQWDQVSRTAILPQIQSILASLDPFLHPHPGWHGWAEAYLQVLQTFLDTVSRHYESQAQERSGRIARELDAMATDLSQSPTLSQKALRVLSSTPGVDCVLVGMRQTDYVDDALAVFQFAAIENALDILRKSPSWI